MKKYLLIGLAAVFCFAFLRKAKGTSGMSDPETSLDNIRRGVANGWYTCALTRVNGKPAVCLSETTWQTLKNEGYKVI